MQKGLFQRRILKGGLMRIKEGRKKQFVEEKKEENPFKNYPLGVWMGSYCYFCPECGKPVPLCMCSVSNESKKKIEGIKVN